MKGLVFKPWVGNLYDESKSRIFVLGESHYGKIEDEDLSDFTNYIVKLFLSYKEGKIEHHSWMTTFSKFSNVINNSKLEFEELKQFWESIVFYNYVQNAMEDNRISPSKDDFSKSYNSFLNVLSEYKPNVIIVWGQRLWNNIPNDHIEKVNGKSFIKTENSYSEIFQINHPASSHFNHAYWESLAINVVDYLK